MAASSVNGPRASTAQDFMTLLKKSNSDDADIRYMVLADMSSMLENSQPNILSSDEKYSPDIVARVVELVDDANGDVQSQALKTVGPLGNKLGAETLKEFVAKLALSTTSKSLDTSIYITAVRTVVASLPKPTNAGLASKEVLAACDAVRTVVIPRLTGQSIKDPKNRFSFSGRGLLELNDNGSATAEGIELAAQTVLCYGVLLTESEKKSLLTRLLAILDDERPTVIAQKKAVSAIASLSLYLTEAQFFTDLIPSINSRLARSTVTIRQRRMLATLIGSLAVTASRRIETGVSKLVPRILEAVSEEQFNELTAAAQEDGADIHREEVVEASLAALEELFNFCGKAMAPHADEAIAASLRFLTYDPNLIEEDSDDDEDMVEEDDFAVDEDDDFEDDGVLSDSDDSSWKIRRCSAKAIHAIIKAGASADLLENGVLYDKIAPVLIKRFSEREESVRLEIIAAVALLIKKTADATTLSFHTTTKSRVAGQPTISRKRRRSSTVQSAAPPHIANNGELSPRASPSPTSGPQSDLAKVASRIANAALTVYKQKSVPSKQAAASLLRDLILARQGKLDEQLGQLLPATIEIASTMNTALGGAAGSSSTATGTTLRIACLQLLAVTCDNHSSKVLEPFMSKVTSAVVASAKDSHFKIAAESVLTFVSIIQTLTPPRTLGASDKSQVNLAQIFDVLLEQAESQSIELEVRLNAIKALGILLARTAGQSKLLTTGKRQQVLKVLSERLKNEVTRLATIDAIDSIANAPITSTDYPPEWLQATTVELGGQLRKSDRTLSSNSLSTLNNILSQDNVGEILGDGTSTTLIQLLLPSVNTSGAGQLTVALLCLSQLIQASNIGAVDHSLFKDIVELAKSPMTGSPLYAYLDLVETIGSSGAGKSLLGPLMQVGVGGPAEVVGSAIGTILAVSKSDLGVTYKDIVAELQSTTDEKRRALALSVLGQYGMCLGTSSPLTPQDFLPYLDAKADVSRAAAMALGRAGSANTATFFPVILNELQGTQDIKRQSALLPAVKEILVKSSPRRSDISTEAEALWGILMRVAAIEDNRAVGAECVGKLVSINPAKFVPQVRSKAGATSKDVRALIIQSLRFALADSDSSLDEHIRPVIAPLLTTMLRDQDIENRRLALMTLNATFSAKPAVISPHLSQLIHIVVERSRVDPSLVREIQMGPFKHKVDDGLDIRKSAYETLHALIDVAYSRIDSGSVIERIIDGLGDDHDIKILCALIISKLVDIDKQQIARHLHEIAARFTPTVGFKLKETAVKQEIERATEAQRDVLKASLTVNDAFGNGTEVDPIVWTSWKAYMDMLAKDYKTQLTQAEALRDTR